MKPLYALILLAVVLAFGTAFQAGSRAKSLSFSDPANVVPPPSGAVGFPSRDPGFDARPGFQSPPPGYGNVAFFWWLGDPLTKERLTWHLDQLKGHGVTGLQINYAHTDQGGVSYGLSMPSDPPIFTPAWWSLVEWFAGEAYQRGMSISLSDYTLGLGQGKAMDAAVSAEPGLVGSELRRETKTIEGGAELDWPLPSGWLSVTAIPKAGATIDLGGSIREGRLRWRAPEGSWDVLAVSAQKVVPSYDPTHPDSGRAYIEHFFAPFEKHLPGQGGRALNFFFSDELEFRLPGFIWSERLAGEFRARKGYDLRPLLAGLFADIGPLTPKVRLDYGDVRVALSEENFFRPVFEWHQKRGMIFGCDHGGRGQDVTEFGDYFRTQRWNQGPGCDQPLLEKNLIKAKVAASIAHLYDRPRVWLEGYHSSGWGTTSAAVADATFADFLMGHNLLSFHGLYYSTHGGFWEWAPPDNHWRMPYWGHLAGFTDAVRRLSFLLSQGRHVCDTAVLYPVAPMEAGMDGPRAVEAAFDTGRALYGAGLDFDFIDFESVLRAGLENGALSVSGERYRVLILPAMRAIRFEILEKAARFAAAGGTVIAVGALPEASERAGRDDEVLDRQVAGFFGLDSRAAAGSAAEHVRVLEGGGRVAVVPGAAEAVGLIEKTIGRDADFPRAAGKPVYFQHRRVGPRDVYGLYGLPRGAVVHFRARGAVELWDPWTGSSRPLAVLEQGAAGTRLRLPLEATEIQLIVFGPGRARIEAPAPASSPEVLPVEGPWTMELKPTLDNRWGDFRWPPRPRFIGAEARRFRTVPESRPDGAWTKPDFDDRSWSLQTASFGTMFRKLGPLPAGEDLRSLETRLAALRAIDPAAPVTAGGRTWAWAAYDFSWRWGVEDDPGHQGYHGLKESVSDEFIRLGRPKMEATQIVRETEEGGTVHYLWTTVLAPRRMSGRILAEGLKPKAIWLRGRALGDPDAPVDFEAGPNPLLLRYDGPGTGWVLAVEAGFVLPAARPGALTMRWADAPGILPFEAFPRSERTADLYRFMAAPGLKALTVTALGDVEAWADGRPLRAVSSEAADGAGRRIRFVPDESRPEECVVALRIRSDPGRPGGAALSQPVEFECGEGRIAVGDWSAVDGLRSYSGGILYRKTVTLPAAWDGDGLSLDLGGVSSSAEVFVNGRPAGVRVAPPWRWDIGGLARPGENEIRVLVCNTLSNHYSTIPTRYRGSSASGLLGPVRLIREKRP